MSETTRIADQLRRAFDGEAWHGDSLFEILQGVPAKQAAAHPIKNAHSIWELLLHIAAWDGACRRRLLGETVQLEGDDNFPPILDDSDEAWSKAQQHAKDVHNDLVEAVAVFPESRLTEKVPGKKPAYYNSYYMLHGLAQHEVYHAGQIALLKKMV
jgi:uncharacterized damage-inducible protein DinB